jgi:hypothetical protein
VSSLKEQVAEFTGELNDLLQAVLPHAPDVLAERQGARWVIRPEQRAPLHISGDRISSLDVRAHCRMDSRGEWLAVDQSYYVLSADLDRTPVLRFDYVRDARTAPARTFSCTHTEEHCLTCCPELVTLTRTTCRSSTYQWVVLGSGRPSRTPCSSSCRSAASTRCRTGGWRLRPAARPGGAVKRAQWPGTSRRRRLGPCAHLGYQVEAPQEPVKITGKALYYW